MTIRSRNVYGPVLSHRLGRSLGVDLVPFKTCTYDCIYCQLGRTTRKTTERDEYVPIDDVLLELADRLEQKPSPDYISLAGSGEPTLNSRVGDLILGIKRLTHLPVAVLTNGSLLWARDVQDALLEADLVLPSLDAGDESLFTQINRPHQGILFEAMIDGLVEFRERFRKPIWLEIFLLSGHTGTVPEVRKIAAIADRIRPDRIQLNTVLRPPAEEFAASVPVDRLRSFARLFNAGADVMSESRPDDSSSSATSAVTDEALLALLARRPCTARGAAVGLGLHVNDVAKRLAYLYERGVIRARRNRRDVFYAIEERNE